MKKSRISLLLILSMLMALLAGCGSKNTLTVYVCEADKLFKDAQVEYAKLYPNDKIKVKSFETYDKLNEHLNEELKKGKGPDVVLYNSLFNAVAPYKMAASGMFLPLDELMADLSEDTYYKQILDAGKVNGQQYYIPLSWNVLQVYSNPEKLTEENLYASILAEADLVKGEESKALNNFLFYRSDWMNYFMEISGTELFDANTGEMTAQKENVKEIAEFLKTTMYDMYDQSYAVLQKYNKSFEDSIGSISYLMENNSFLASVRLMEAYYQGYYEVDVALSHFERLDGEGITAQVMQYGAINANTDKPEMAWNFLQCIMDIQPTVSFRRGDFENTYYAPVKITAYETCINNLTKYKGPGARVGAKVGPLSSELGQQLLEIPDQIVKAVIPNYTSYGRMVQECMLPYLNGEADFDSCYDKLVQQTEAYLSE